MRIVCPGLTGGNRRKQARKPTVSIILRRRRTSYLVSPLRGSGNPQNLLRAFRGTPARRHRVTDEVEPDNRSAKTAIENSFHHLIRRYTPPSPQGEDLERVRFRKRLKVNGFLHIAPGAQYIMRAKQVYHTRRRRVYHIANAIYHFAPTAQPPQTALEGGARG